MITQELRVWAGSPHSKVAQPVDQASAAYPPKAESKEFLVLGQGSLCSSPRPPPGDRTKAWLTVSPPGT